MAWLFASGHAVDLVLIVIVVEAAWLIWRGEWPMSDIIIRLMPAVLILLALRAALTDMDWLWIALPLALSFPVHLADIGRGWPRR